MLKDLVKNCRSIRRFKEDQPLTEEFVVDLIDTARLTSCGQNKQSLRYMYSAEKELNAQYFSCLGWAAALKDWMGPAEGERPTGYITILAPKTGYGKHDCGIAAQTMMLAAAEQGVGCCMLGNVNRKKLTEIIGVPEEYEILLVLAFGVPGETVVLEEMKAGGNFNYYRTEDQVHHVPKLRLEDVILK